MNEARIWRLLVIMAHSSKDNSIWKDNPILIKIQWKRMSQHFLLCLTSNKVNQYRWVKFQKICVREGSLLAFIMVPAGKNYLIPFEQWQGQDIIIFSEINNLCNALIAFISNLITGHMQWFIWLLGLKNYVTFQGCKTIMISKCDYLDKE